jgi:hypothetical protein
MNNYYYIENADQYSFDLCNIKDANLDDLFQISDKNNEAKCFNTGGWLKYEVRQMTDTKDLLLLNGHKGLFIKEIYCPDELKAVAKYIKRDNKCYNFVSFNTEGEPYDEGYNLSKCVDYITSKLKNFDNIKFYQPRELIKMGYGDYVKKYPSLGCCTYNRNFNKIGFAAYKPLIIKLELEKMNDGDILVYRDCNVYKYDCLRYGYDKLKETANMCLEQCGFDFFVPKECDGESLKHHCKSLAVREMSEGIPLEYLFECPILIANIIIVRKSVVSMELLEDWLKACEVERWITGDYNIDPHPDFKWFTPEQSLLSVVVAKWIYKKTHNIPKNYPNLMFFERYLNKWQIPKNTSYLNLIK